MLSLLTHSPRVTSVIVPSFLWTVTVSLGRYCVPLAATILTPHLVVFDPGECDAWLWSHEIQLGVVGEVLEVVPPEIFLKGFPGGH